MNLYEDAQIQYEELEESFFQALEGWLVPVLLELSDSTPEKNLPWFGNLGGKTSGDDSRTILNLMPTSLPPSSHSYSGSTSTLNLSSPPNTTSTTASSTRSSGSKPYRDLILNNTITLFDFRIYLFSCKFGLLAKRKMWWESLAFGEVFIRAFARMLGGSEVGLLSLI